MMKKLLLVAIAFLLQGSVLAAEDGSSKPFWQNGKWEGSLRLRFELSDDSVNKDAYLPSLRASVKYTTEDWAKWQLVTELEHVAALIDNKYNDGGVNRLNDYAVIADPVGSDVNEVHLKYTGFANNVIKFGRHKLGHRAYPWQRYIGTVSFRQNEQTVDGFSISNTTFNGLTLNASYLYNVNRIFGEKNPLPNRSDYKLHGTLMQAAKKFSDEINLEFYYYGLDFAKASTLSTNTIGSRVGGQFNTANLVYSYALELASQSDAFDNPISADVAYAMIDGGLTMPEYSNLTVKLTLEKLEGTGDASFKTPLATLHAYQGWIDKFLSTPNDGIIDTYVTVKAKIAEANNLVFVWHHFKSDVGSYDYGSEWGIQLTRKIGEHVNFGTKFAQYHADKNVQRTGGPFSDTQKFWVWAATSF